MSLRRRVVLYGRSVILGTVGASLSRYPDLEIVELAPPLPGVDELRALEPDVILFDAEIERPEPIFALLQNCPDLLLVGINPENAQMLVWSSEQSSVLSAEDIVRVITHTAE